MIKFDRKKKKLVVPTGLGNRDFVSHLEAYEDGYQKGYNKGYADAKAENSQLEG